MFYWHSVRFLAVPRWAFKAIHRVASSLWPLVTRYQAKKRAKYWIARYVYNWDNHEDINHNRVALALSRPSVVEPNFRPWDTRGWRTTWDANVAINAEVHLRSALISRTFPCDIPTFVTIWGESQDPPQSRHNDQTATRPRCNCLDRSLFLLAWETWYFVDKYFVRRNRIMYPRCAYMHNKYSKSV